MKLPLPLKKVQATTRRQFFGQTGLGLGSIALSSLLNQESPDEPTGFRIPAKAKSVIYLHMAGSPSQLELFEHKPALDRLHDTECPQEYLEGKRFAFIRGVPKMLGSQFKFQRTGESGQWVSDRLPLLSKIIGLLAALPITSNEY